MHNIHIVGLGNGPRYRKTRHNAGSDLVEYIKASDIDQVKCTVIKSHGQLNNSGSSLSRLGINISECIVAYDDVELPYGACVLSSPARARGHNGIRSIISTYNTNQFSTLRLGIGKSQPLHEYVLQTHKPKQMTLIYRLFHWLSSNIEVLRKDEFSYNITS